MIEEIIKGERKEDGLDFLPESMLKEILEKEKNEINKTKDYFIKLSNLKVDLRKVLEEKKIIGNILDLGMLPSDPTVVGVDGTNVIIRRLSLDSMIVAAVAVEGLIPPKEERFWPQPHHVVKIFQLPHWDYTKDLLRCLMFMYELKLASEAPHKVVMLDGSFTSFLTGLGIGLEKLKNAPNGLYELVNEIINNREETLKNFLKVLQSPKTDQIFASIPKYTSRKEVTNKIIDDIKDNSVKEILERVDDKALLTILLRAGEFTEPIELEKPQSEWHLTGIEDKEVEKEIRESMENIYIFYVKPSPIHPAIRVEISKNVAKNKNRLKILIQAVMSQTKVPGVIEPFPLYVADLFVKSVYPSLLELRDIVINELAKDKSLDINDFVLSLHSYRSEVSWE